MNTQQHPEALRAKISGFRTEALQDAARRLAAKPRLSDAETQVAGWIGTELQRRMIAADFVAFMGELETIMDHAA